MNAGHITAIILLVIYAVWRHHSTSLKNQTQDKPKRSKYDFLD